MSSSQQKFLALLKEDILKLDLAELDFGIYRILNYRRREIDAFLDRDLPLKIVAALAKLPGSASEDEQSRVFHHLYTFFSRYYEDGDFITRPRRGRDAAYSVPYNGQDVHFWWATKGSHYVKSGERFASYVWRDGPRAIRIEVVKADVEKDNVKGDKRYYLPEAIDESDDGLRIKLTYRTLENDETKRYERKRSGESEEDEEDDGGDEGADGKTTQERVLNAWLTGGGARRARIPAGIDKALLKKHLTRYVAGQTSDFFVHPQLGAFLAGELEYYLKNEFMQVWDRADGDALARERGKLAIVREIGQSLISFLAAIEDVQAALFEKRKFVLASDWLVRISALDASNSAAQALIAEACANLSQVNEWRAWLGEELLARSTKARTLASRGKELVTAYPHLCIHTKHFDERYKYRLLSLFDDIHAAAGGVLVHAENYGALRTLEYAYRRRIKCVYIDPPYNTGKDDFLYADALGQHGTWATMIFERLTAVRSSLRNDATVFASIDRNERERLDHALGQCLGTANNLGEIIWHNVTDNNPTQVATEHEYVECYAASAETRAKPWKSAISDAKEALIGIGSKLIEEHGDTPILRREYSKWFRDNKIFLGPLDRYKYIDAGGVYTGSQSVHNPGKEGYRYDINHPVTGKPCTQPLMGYRFPKETMDKLLAEKRVLFGDDETKLVELKVYAHEFEDKRSSIIELDGRVGANEVRALFGTLPFRNPKPTGLMEELLPFVAGGSDDVADFFAGSGTTGHATINLNRDDGGNRHFMLVEQGEYFDSVLLPRIAKIIAALEWKDGKPKPGQSMHATDSEDPDGHWSARSPKLVQVLRLERYEDSLDSLELPDEAAARRAGQMSFSDPPLRYVYEAAAASASVALNTAHLSRPFDLQIPQLRDGAPVLVPVDVASTALLLLGLHPVRIRDLRGHAGRDGKQRYLLIEARANGEGKALCLLVLRDVDETMTGSALKVSARSESDWLTHVVQQEFGRNPQEYDCVWHNRDLYLQGAQSRSLDSELARRMLERAPAEPLQ